MHKKINGEVIENLPIYGEVDTSSNNGLSTASSANSTQRTIARGQEIDILGAGERKTVNIKNGENAENIARKIDKISGTTGIEATSSTHAMLSFENSSNSSIEDFVSFNLHGIDEKIIAIAAEVDFGSGVNNMNLSPLRTEINKYSDQTGITAYLTEIIKLLIKQDKVLT